MGDLFSSANAENENSSSEEEISGSENPVNEDNYTEEEKYSNLKSLKDIETRYYLVDNEEKRGELIDKLNWRNLWAFDTETTSTDPMSGDLVGFSFSFDENEAYYVPVPENREEADRKSVV